MRVSATLLLSWIDWIIESGAAERGAEFSLVRPMLYCGLPPRESWQIVYDSLAIVVKTNPDVEYEGEMAFDDDRDAVAFRLQFQCVN